MKVAKILCSVLLTIIFVAILSGGVYAVSKSNTPNLFKIIVSHAVVLVVGMLSGLAIIAMYGTKSLTDSMEEAKGTLSPNTKVASPTPSLDNIDFSQVAGADEEKEELREIVAFLKHPAHFSAMGIRLPKGVLLAGPPGTGKTLLAQALAGEAGVPFIRADASTFCELYVGVGAKRVRQVFDIARGCNGSCVVFIDEIDAIGKKRGMGEKSDSEREQTLNQLLVEMDGFTKNTNIVVLAATNRIDTLDPALLRAGRFDRKIEMQLPDIRGRAEILAIHANGKPLADDVSLDAIAKLTPGCSGADLAGIMNEAAIMAIRNGHEKINNADVNEAVKRVLYGLGKKSAVISEEDLYVTAIHEVGHALVAHYTPSAPPVQEISIIPRGQAMGYTSILSDDVTSHMSRSKILAYIDMLLGGRIAEELFCGELFTGAEGDLGKVHALAEAMITSYGMTDTFGSLVLEGKNLSESAKQSIWELSLKTVREAEERVRELLLSHKREFHTVVRKLLDCEQMDANTFADLLASANIN